jgi:hypothetical protein
MTPPVMAKDLRFNNLYNQKTVRIMAYRSNADLVLRCCTRSISEYIYSARTENELVAGSYGMIQDPHTTFPIKI